MAKFKIIALCVLLLSFLSVNAQLTPMTAFQYGFKRIVVDSTLQIPSFCGTPTLRNSIVKNGALAMDTCNNKLYKYTRANGWSEVAGGQGNVPTLQAVTDAGNTSNKAIILDNSFTSLYLDSFDITTPSIAYPINYKNSFGPEFYLYDNFTTAPAIIGNSATDNSYYKLGIDYNNGNNHPILTAKATNTERAFTLTDTAIAWVDSTNASTKIISRGSSNNASYYLPKNNGVDKYFVTSVNNNIPDDNGNVTIPTIDTANKWVNSITRTAGKDSIIYYIGSTRYAIKDSVGSGGSSQNGRFGNDTATVVMAKVHNNSGVQLTNGNVVFLATSGTSSDAPSVRLANNKADSTSANTFGFVSGTINNNDTGWVVLSGKIEKLNTSAFSNGDVIYLDSISGQWTKTKPVAPYHMVYLGVVVKANAGNGSIFVKCQNGYELDEIHDVLITSKTNNDVLSYESSTKLWKNKQISSVLGYTPIAPADTASMLTNYAKTSVVNAADALKVNISDTASMLSKYVRKDTACLYLISDVSTSNTTATNTNLTYPIAANETYRIMIAGTCSKATTTTGMKIAIAGPTGSSIKSVIQGGQALMVTAPQGQLYSTINSLCNNVFATGAGVEVPFRLEGVITNGANAGSITLQFATVTSNAATIYSGTVMQLIKAKGL